MKMRDNMNLNLMRMRMGFHKHVLRICNKIYNYIALEETIIHLDLKKIEEKYHDDKAE